MKLTNTAGLAIVIALLVALPGGCLVTKSPGSGSTGSGGSGSGSGGSDGGSTAAQGGSDAGGGGSAAATCDDGGVCGDTQSGCLGCALAGPCAAAFAACENSIECADFESCLGTCRGSQPCIDMCVTTYADGASLYINVANCLYCGECYVSCDGANAGCQ